VATVVGWDKVARIVVPPILVDVMNNGGTRVKRNGVARDPVPAEHAYMRELPVRFYEDPPVVALVGEEPLEAGHHATGIGPNRPASKQPPSVGKPFSYPELRLRLLAVLRRAGLRPARGRLRVGPLEIDPASRDVTLGGERLTLSQKEYGLLVLLASQPTRVFTKDEILREVWGFRARSATRTLDSHACRLRAKLAHPDVRFVLNVWGVGYRLVDVVETAA
jgi:DNA-binding winged helix-turn-helix (wHTH) protein